MSDMIQCHGCTAMVQGLSEAALPAGWDVARTPGCSPVYFCTVCVDAGTMEQYRAQQGLPRRAQWRFANGIMAVYRPATRQVLLATPDGMAEICEHEAEQLVAAIAAALSTRGIAAQLEMEARR